MNLKFDILDLIIIAIIGFIAGAIRSTSFPPNQRNPKLGELSQQSLPSSEARFCRQESGFFEINAGEVGVCPTQNSPVLSGQLIRRLKNDTIQQGFA